MAIPPKIIQLKPASFLWKWGQLACAPCLKHRLRSLQLWIEFGAALTRVAGS
jgi:hypothetical protein